MALSLAEASARKSRTPNYDSLHRRHQITIDRKVVRELHGYPHGPRRHPDVLANNAERRPNDIDTFRELFSIEFKARRLQEALIDVADNREGRQKRYDAAKAKAITQLGLQAVARMGFFAGVKPPKRREHAAAALDANRIV